MHFSFPGNAISQSSHGIRCFQVAFAIRHAEYNPRKHHCITVPNKSQDVGDVWEIHGDSIVLPTQDVSDLKKRGLRLETNNMPFKNVLGGDPHETYFM